MFHFTRMCYANHKTSSLKNKTMNKSMNKYAIDPLKQVSGLIGPCFVKSWNHKACSDMNQNTSLKGSVFDFSGTLVDAGVKAPVMAFSSLFEKYKVPITIKEARKPMGHHKKAHIYKISEIPRVKKEWKKVYGRSLQEEDLNQMFKEFIPTQLEVLPKHTNFIPGALETLQFIRHYFGIQIGCTTGFTRVMANLIVKDMKKKNNFTLDCLVTSDEVNYPRPHQGGCVKNQISMKVKYPFEMIKIGDTVPDIEEGRNAGFWTVGLIKYGNDVGLEPKEIKQLEKESPEQLMKLYQKACNKLWKAKPDYIAFEITSLPFILKDINTKLKQGCYPRSFEE